MKVSFLLLVVAAIPVLGGCVPARVTEVARASGTVVNGNTGTPVAMAQVRCSEAPELVTPTDAQGHFSLPQKDAWHMVRLGGDWLSMNCSLIVSAPGYADARAEVFLGDDRPKIIRLAPVN